MGRFHCRRAATSFIALVSLIAPVKALDVALPAVDDIDMITGAPIGQDASIQTLQAIPQELGEVERHSDLPHRFLSSSGGAASGAGTSQSFVTSAVIERARNEAASGSPDAHYVLGLAYYYGDGVEESKHRALSFFKEAARLGHAQSHVNLGHMLELGVGTNADPNAAYAYYRQASVKWQDVEASFRASVLLYGGKVSTRVATWEQGMNAAKDMLDIAVAANHPKSFFYLASIYEYGGADVPANFTEAHRLYRIGCQEHDDVECCYNLGLMTAFGRGLVQDWSASANLFQQAADYKRHGPSAYYLGLQFTNGQGVPTDYRLGEKYLQQALDSGDERVKDKALRALEDLRRANSFAEALNQAELRELEKRLQKETPDEEAAGVRPSSGGEGRPSERGEKLERVREAQEARYASLRDSSGGGSYDHPALGGASSAPLLKDEEVEAILARLAIPGE